MTASLQNALEMARLELLDMGLRGNTLLNLRHTALTIPVVQEKASEIYRLLVLEQRALRFLPVSDAAQAEHDQPEDAGPVQASVLLPALADPQAQDKAYADLALQTRMSAQVLDQRLVKISHAARSYYEEQGVEILYLALGCLWWRDDRSQALRRAPLVLVPVELQRAAAGQGFRLVYTGADLGPNLTLAAKLKSEFHVQLPAWDEDGFAYTEYLSAVSQAIAAQKGWQVAPDEICLGFFLFGKFQMYQDLDPEPLLAGDVLQRHPLLADLFAGRLGAADALGQDWAAQNSAPDLTELNFVKDADTSQTQAVMAVVQGHNLVIQGPPGTGKSQTITNIIAELLGRGKRVLFVAEKMAALEVVKRRLDESHLGDAVLELHSHKSQRKAVVEALAQSLEAGVPQTPDRSQARARHRQLQQQLDAYAAAVAAPILNSGMGYVQALAESLRMQRDYPALAEQPLLDFAWLRDWDANDFAEALHQVDVLIAHLQAHGSVQRSVWGESGLQQFAPDQQQRLQAQLTQLQSALQACQQAQAALAQELAQVLGEEPCPAMTTLAQITQVTGSLDMLLRAPAPALLQSVDGLHSAWTSGAMAQWWALQQQMQSVRARREGQLIEQAWQADVLGMRAAWASTADKWWRLVSGDFRAARRQLQGLLKQDMPEDAAQCLAIVDDILACQSLNAQAQSSAGLVAQVLGDAVQMQDRQALGALMDWMLALAPAQQQGQVLTQTWGWAQRWSVEQREAMAALGRALAQAQQALCEGLQTVAQQVQWRGGSWLAESGALSDLQSSVQQAQAQLADLYAVVRFNQIESSLDSPALRALAARARCWEHPQTELLRAVLQASWYGGLVQAAYREHPVLATFDRAAHEHAIAEFAALDKALFVFAQERLVKTLHERLPAALATGEMAVLRREMNKKRRHMPLRQLMREAGRVIQQIKPVFMMSPMSVATYLEHGSVEFDVVIFDEASQVRVADALGALLRARQAVVVGDSRQMPPTDFFSRSLELDDDQAQASQTADIESILGMFVAQGAPQQMLRWHYRSRHDSLIAVSNQAFYEGRLWVFPTPGVQPRATGLRLHHLPQTCYDRGQSRSNPGEARAVAEAVLQHARQTPNLSLGVVAFSTAQRDCLLLEIERLRREQPELEGFFNQRRSDGEDFFVKNLENVQGDERDVIFISIGYGRSEDGKLVPSFGPVNHEGGERRLNVLMTRAKLAMEVFCNFTADDLRLDAATPLGVRALHSFLAYAQTRQLPATASETPVAAGGFEQYLCQEIMNLGYPAQARMGQSGFFIDVAVQDTATETRYALAVQTDGASYQKSADARERDRVRLGVLAGFGWNLQQTWSVDWYRTPGQERARLREAIAAALQKLQADLAQAAESTQKVDKAEDVKVREVSEASAVPDMSASEQTGDASAVGQESALPAEQDPGQQLVPVSTEVAAALPADASIDRVDALTALLQSVPVYEIYAGELGLPRHQQLHEALPESLSASIRRLVVHEGPLHQEVIVRRLMEAAGVSRLTPKVQQRIAQGLAYGVASGELFQTQDFVHAEAQPQVEPRSRAGLPALYRHVEYISPFEIRTALRQVLNCRFGMAPDEAVAVTLELLGFVRATAKAKAVVEAELASMKRSGEVVLRQGGLQRVV